MRVHASGLSGPRGCVAAMQGRSMTACLTLSTAKWADLQAFKPSLCCLCMIRHLCAIILGLSS